MANDLSLIDPRFIDPVAAAEYLESVRWPSGVVCPKCGEAEREPYLLKGKSLKQRRVWKCRACRKQFSVMVGTIFESSHVPLNKWLAAFYLLCSSKKGMSAHQLHRMLDVTYKTAWFMFHRIREAMKEPAFAEKLSGVVEADETYIGGKRKNMHGKETRGRPPQKDGLKTKAPVLSLVERGGRVRSQRVAKANTPWATSTSIPSRATSRFSSAASTGSTTTYPAPTWTATWASLTSATTAAASQTQPERSRPSRWRRASV